MKIIKQAFTGERIVGKFKCKGCTSELEVHVEDCSAGQATDYSGDKESYVGFKCMVCQRFNQISTSWYDTVDEYQRSTKAAEARLRHAKPPAEEAQK